MRTASASYYTAADLDSLGVRNCESILKANCEKFDSGLGELGKLDDLADSCVSSGMAFWKGTERLAN